MCIIGYSLLKGDKYESNTTSKRATCSLLRN